jgi:micrococcal nuclease
MTTWTVPATVLRVVDGDTLEVLLDLGWHITFKSKLRLAGVNAPEMKTSSGAAARDFTVQRLLPVDPAADPRPITVVSHSLDKYGRILGSVHWTDDDGTLHDLSTDLLAAGHAVRM